MSGDGGKMGFCREWSFDGGIARRESGNEQGDSLRRKCGKELVGFNGRLLRYL